MHADLMRPSALMSVVNASVDAIVHIGLNSVILSWNESATQMFDYTPHEIVGRPIWDLCPKDRVEEQADILGEVLAGRRVNPFDTVCLRRDSSRIHVSIAVSPVLDSERRTTGVTYIIRDITERVRETEQASQRKRLEGVGRLAGGIAHDFNNMLMAILGHAEMAMLEVPADSQAREDLLGVLEGVQRASELTDKLLAFSQEREFAPRTVHVSDMLPKLESLLRSFLPESIEVTTSADSTGAVRIDPRQLEQVVVNLAVNANDAMPEGGRLGLAVNDTVQVREGKVPVGEYVVIKISDTGVGMTDSAQQRIFDPFYSTKETGEGSGMGLSVAYGVINRADGYIIVTSAPRRGTVVELWLPRTMPSGRLTSQAPADSRPPGTGTVLVVEDDQGVRAIARRILSKLGYEVLEAENGAEALDRVAEHAGAIDLTLTDAVMPVMGGQEFIKRFRQLRPACPVLLMSGYAGERDGSGPVDRDSVGFLRKPFSVDSLARAVRAAIDD